ncbi:37S ribosomal protein S24, mitochondrial [Saxophila tyrrhenica]|uniref:37S ribosomal protein S24, mitochondrial n=1 Tax=Saxophila tyrrhenica TaxID=1690608 RepID=A0AAV9NY53_9PEZI|nr:37S ribosomal protein S24, mitochondrial [Saxophila tyrrhenica]
MGTPSKRLCVRALLSWPSQRTFTTSACRHASSTAEDDIDLDALTSQSGVTDTSTTESRSDLMALKSMDLSSRAHRELEQHRELREMVRLAAWEMPLLSQLSRPHVPPREDQVLRWRYTTYMGEVHPAARKVVVEFQPERIPNLSDKQRQKLLKLAGPRYEPGTKTVKMSCESFETQARNKRYLADTISSLVTTARDQEGDQFEDVPLDVRHYKPKTKYKYPKEWIMTAQRKKELEGKRRAAMLEDGRRVEEGRLISGIKAIEEARKVSAKAIEEPIMAEARRPMVKGKMGRKEMGQRGGRVQ